MTTHDTDEFPIHRKLLQSLNGWEIMDGHLCGFTAPDNNVFLCCEFLELQKERDRLRQVVLKVAANDYCCCSDEIIEAANKALENK